MGNIMGGGKSAAVAEVVEKEVVKKDKDNRKRNSLAFNIASFVQFEEEDYTPLLDAAKAELAKRKKTKARAADVKLNVIAERVAQGSMKQLREQVVLDFKHINRKFRERFRNATLLHIICQQGYYDMLDFLLEEKNHPPFDDVPVELGAKNDRNRTPLFMCFTPPQLTFLGLQYGIDSETGLPNSQRPDGIEVIQDWIKPGGPRLREACIRLLIEKGANFTDPDFHGFTPLHYASMYGWLPTVSLLIKRGADVNAGNIAGRTPMMYAVEYQNERLLEILLASEKRNVNLFDNDGTTVLMMALQAVIDVNPPPPFVEEGEEPVVLDHIDDSSHVAICEVLLRAGADPNSSNNRKRSCLQIACERSHKVLIHLLLNYGCHPDPTPLALLNAEVGKDIHDRLHAEEKRQELAAAQQEKERRALLEDGLDGDAAGNGGAGNIRSKNPYGQWVEYADKRSKTAVPTVFYYNKVSRVCQREKPKDFRPDKNRITTEAIFGMHFYH